MAFLAAHAARLSQKEPRWLLLTRLRLVAVIFALVSGLMFSLCGHFFTGVQWSSESQYFGTSMVYICFGIGLAFSVVVNAAFFIMLCGRWHYLLPAGANVGIECFLWMVMLAVGFTGSALFNYDPARVYCPGHFDDSNYQTGYKWCMKNWDLIKASERGGMVFYFLCAIAHFALFVQACRRVDVERKAKKERRRLQRAAEEAAGGKQDDQKHLMRRILGRAGRGFRGGF